MKLPHGLTPAHVFCPLRCAQRFSFHTSGPKSAACPLLSSRGVMVVWGVCVHGLGWGAAHGRVVGDPDEGPRQPVGWGRGREQERQGGHPGHAGLRSGCSVCTGPRVWTECHTRVFCVVGLHVHFTVRAQPSCESGASGTGGAGNSVLSPAGRASAGPRDCWPAGVLGGLNSPAVTRGFRGEAGTSTR